jgi:hypothetical protein
MKSIKIFALIISSMLFVSKAHAQAYGIKGGFNRSTIEVKNLPFDFHYIENLPIFGIHIVLLQNSELAITSSSKLIYC